MARYIDAEKIKYHELSMCGGHGLNFEYTVAYKHEVDAIPTADVIPKDLLTRKEDEAYERGYAEAKSEVIRCKDCAYLDGELCKYHSNKFDDLTCDPDDFCSAAIRRATDDQG